VIPKELLAALRTIEIHTARLANEQLSGTYTSSFKGQGLAFREVRPYQPGDDVRAIDWNVSARMNDTFVKVFVEEREMTVMLVVDLSSSEREKHVMRVVREILGFEPTLTFDHAPAGAGDVRARAYDDRGRMRLGAATDLKAALETLVRVSRRRSVAFVVSDFYDTGYERALALASAKHDVVPVVLVDARDAELPDVGLATFEDLESGESVVVDTSDSGVRAWYSDANKRLGASRRAAFNKLGLDSVEIDTGGSFVHPLRDLFARRARRIRR
jgi:uncharacterized protein (DUF58 family)